MLKILGSKTCFTLMLHIAVQSSSQNSYSETRNSHCKGALVNDMAATTHICQILKPLEYGVGRGGESKLVLLDNLMVKLGPKGAATAFSHRWWWKAARWMVFIIFWKNVNNIFNVGLLIILSNVCIFRQNKLL
jgi:hypothetical protein